MMRIPKLILFGAMALSALSSLAGPLDARLTFSTDGGKTWGEDHPRVKQGQPFLMRATYTIGDERDNRDVMIASLMFPEKYASMTKDRVWVYRSVGAIYEGLRDWESALETYRRSLNADFNQPDMWDAEKNMLKKLGRAK